MLTLDLWEANALWSRGAPSLAKGDHLSCLTKKSQRFLHMFIHLVHEKLILFQIMNENKDGHRSGNSTWGRHSSRGDRPDKPTRWALHQAPLKVCQPTP